MKKILFYSLMTVLMVFSILIILELSFRCFLFLKNPKESLPDWREVIVPVPDSVSIGSLTPNYDKIMIGGYGNKIRWKNNSHGFRYEKDIQLKKDTNTIRILALGDSFTAGYRIDQKNTFCYLLEDTLKKIIPRKEIEVLPVWVNDPVLGAYYMQKYIEVLNPDLVFYGICLSNDVFQAFFKMSSVGGAFNVNLDSMYVSKIERNNILLSKIENQLNSTTFDNECLNYQNFSFWLITKNRLKNYILNITGKFKSLFFIKNLILSRPGQAIFNYSSYTRPSIFDTNNGLGLFLKNQPSVIDTAYNHFFSALTFQNNLCKRLNIPYFTILYGQRFQVQPKDWQATLIQYQLNENCFDLKLPNRKMKQQFEKNNITFFDPTDTFIQKHKLNKKNLYLPMGDMHWNEEGNRVMADYLLPIILSNVSTK